MKELRLVVARMVIAMILAVGGAPPAHGWGEEGHRFINLVAAQHLPDDMPAFFRNASTRLAFLGPEPDRWRDNRELYKALGEVNGPDHFIDIDKPENFEALPNDRYLYSDWLRAKGKAPKDIGFLPYSLVKKARALQDPFADIASYLVESYKLAPELYRMDKIARWDPNNTRPESKQFVTARLAAGSQMLANLWYTAWINSAVGVENSR